MIIRPTLFGWAWRIALAVAAIAAGQMLGAALLSALGLELPSAPVQVEEGTQALLFLPAATAIAVALAGMAVGLAGRWWERAAVLAAFLYGVYGVGNVVEASIFTHIGGEVPLILMHLPPSVLGALAVALLFPAPSRERFGESLAAFLSPWKPGRLAGRLGLAVLAFPIVYFLFGAMVAPIVTPHYAQLDFLEIPPITTLLPVLLARSVLLLLVSLPVIVGWRMARGGLIIALALGHFVAVGLAGLIQATFFPPALRWGHGIEILADSICYAAVLVWLFVPRSSAAGVGQPALRERIA